MPCFEMLVVLVGFFLFFHSRRYVFLDYISFFSFKAV